MAPRAVIFGLQGLKLSDEEQRFFREADPWGFILFARNCSTPEQIRALTGELRNCVGRNDAPVLIDQEGGRVQRLKAPLWRKAPEAARFGRLFERDPVRAKEAVALNARLIAAELSALGVNVDCLPVLDVPVAGAHDVIGDRAFSRRPEIVSDLGRVVCESLIESGVLPVIKHVPGHGRAAADSHHALPRVDAPRATLEKSDFIPFRALADMPLAMSAHVVYAAIDPMHAGTTSRLVVNDIIRGHIGFEGLLMTDDMSSNMKALPGSYAKRAQDAIAAGCDVVLHCDGDIAAMREVAAVTPLLSGRAEERAGAALARLRSPSPFQSAEAVRRLDALLAA